MHAANLPSAAELAHFSLAAQHPLTRSWQPDEQRLKRLTEMHAFDLQLATDLELAGQRAAFLDVGQDAQAFLNRWVNVPPDLQAMLSIRFEGLDRTRPFVDATVLSRPLTELDLPALAEVAREIYGAFGPHYLRLWSAASAHHFPETLPDKRFLAAPIAELRTVVLPPELSTTPTSDLRHYPDALAAYASVDAQHPGHPEQARIESEETLQELIEAGTLFDVRVGGEWAGYVGAVADAEDDTLGLSACLVQELILSPHVRGQGYGTWLGPLLARALPDQGRMLIGTVHAENRGAVAAAQRGGRVDVGGWVRMRL